MKKRWTFKQILLQDSGCLGHNSLVTGVCIALLLLMAGPYFLCIDTCWYWWRRPNETSLYSLRVVDNCIARQNTSFRFQNFCTLNHCQRSPQMFALSYDLYIFLVQNTANNCTITKHRIPSRCKKTLPHLYYHRTMFIFALSNIFVTIQGKHKIFEYINTVMTFDHINWT